MATAVQERLTITVQEAKLYLRVDGSEEDTLIEELITSAKASADAFLNNPFTSRDGTMLAIPAPVKAWCLRRVAFLYEHRVETLRADTVPGAGTADFGSRISDSNMTTLDYSLLRPHRLNPGL